MQQRQHERHQQQQWQRQVGQFVASLRCRCGAVRLRFGQQKREISRVNNNKGQTALRFNMANLTTISGFGIGIEIFGATKDSGSGPPRPGLVLVLVRIILGYNLAY